jgi:hypothetical protein
METGRRTVVFSRDALIPTNVKGVDTFRALPDDLDLNSVDESVLTDHGIFLQRPTPTSNPAWTAIWNKFAERKWQTIIPTIGTTDFGPNAAILNGRLPPHWQPPNEIGQPGYAICSVFSAPGQPWGEVNALWTCPNLTAPPQGVPQGDQPTLAWWVGLDAGETVVQELINGEMLQAGFDTALNYPSAGDVWVSPPWWWWFAPVPGDPTALGTPVHAFITNFVIDVGDEVLFQLSYLFAHYSWAPPGEDVLRGALSIWNGTKNHFTTMVFSPPAGANGAGASIEWVVENLHWSNPSAGMSPVVPSFSTVEFSGVGQGNPANGEAAAFGMQDTTIAGSPTVVTVAIGQNSVTMSYT